MATKFIAKHETYRNAWKGIYRYQEIEFNNRLDAEQQVLNWKRQHFDCPAWVIVKEDKPKYDPILEKANRTVDRYVDRMFSSGRIF